MVLVAQFADTRFMSAPNAKHVIMDLLGKIAAVIVTLLFYGVIVILQSPAKARAVEPTDTVAFKRASTPVLQQDRPDARPIKPIRQ